MAIALSWSGHSRTPRAAPHPYRMDGRIPFAQNTPPMIRRSGPAGVFAAYLALAVVATWPLAARLSDHVYGLGTPPLNIWAMGWVLHQLPRDPLHLFDGNVFHPYRHSLAFSEHLFVPTMLGAPAAAATGNLVLAHNVVALLTLALAGLGMFLLARELTGDRLAAFAAGLLYAFHTWNINELVRLQILSNQWFPFLLWSLLRFFGAPSRAGAALVAGFVVLQGLSCMYWALYLPLVLGSAVLFLQWKRPAPRRDLAWLGGGIAVAAALIALFALPYVTAGRELALVRDLPKPFDAGRYFDVLRGNRLYAPILGTANFNEGAAHFLGFVALALGGLGALVGRRGLPALAALLRPYLLGLAVAGVLLSLGPRLQLAGRDLGPGPYAFLWHTVPGFRNVRYPERFALFAVLGLAPLVAMGLAHLRRSLRAAGVALAAAVIFLEHLSAPLPLEALPVGTAIPEVYRWLRDEPGARVVAEVPEGRVTSHRVGTAPMYFSTVHWKRTVQGFTGYFPPSYMFVRWRLFHFPRPETLRFLDRFGVDTVVLGPGAPEPPPSSDSPWRLARRFPDGYRVLRHEGPRAAAYEPPPPASGLREVPRQGWEARATSGRVGLALDGDMDTAWEAHAVSGQRDGLRGSFYRVRLPAPVRLARVEVAVTAPYYFPSGLLLSTEDAAGGWSERSYDAEAAYDRLFAWLLHGPREARLEIDVVDARPVRALRLQLTADDPFGMPWTMPELRLYEPVER